MEEEERKKRKGEYEEKEGNKKNEKSVSLEEKAQTLGKKFRNPRI